MLRTLLLAAVVALAASHGHHNYYGLDKYLLRSQVGAALNLVRGRYSGISNPCAAKIIQNIFTRPHRSFLRSINLSFPSARAQRLAYIKSLYRSFPSQIFYNSYINPLAAALKARRINVVRSRLIDSLALSDYFLSLNRARPVSQKLFNDFYIRQLLGLSGSAGHGFQLPGYSTFLSRLSSYRFPGSYFSVPYQGTGYQLLPIFSSVSLRPSVPAVTLPGFYNYLTRQQIAIPSFVSQFRGSFANLYRPISYSTVRRYGSHLGFINSRVFAQDLQPLLALRYYSFPSSLRSNIYLQNVRAQFAPLVSSYFRNIFSGSLLSSYRTYDSRFVSAALNSFDKYCRGMSHGRYHGPYWAGGLLKALTHKYKKG